LVPYIVHAARRFPAHAPNTEVVITYIATVTALQTYHLADERIPRKRTARRKIEGKGKHRKVQGRGSGMWPVKARHLEPVKSEFPRSLDRSRHEPRVYADQDWRLSLQTIALRARSLSTSRSARVQFWQWAAEVTFQVNIREPEARSGGSSPLRRE
jgi:hypothetical protein